MGLFFLFRILPDSTPPKEQAEEISDIPGKEDRLTLRKSMSLDDLKGMAVFSDKHRYEYGGSKEPAVANFDV